MHDFVFVYIFMIILYNLNLKHIAMKVGVYARARVDICVHMRIWRIEGFKSTKYP
jgi:hypothetical protein